jgi:hypothetical protein
MKNLLTLTAFLVACILVAGQPADKEAPAKVTITASRGSVQQTTQGGKTTALIVLQLDKSTKVNAEVNQTAREVIEFSVQEMKKRLARDDERMNEARKSKDLAKVQRIQQEMRENMASSMSNPPTVVEGTLSVNGRLLSLRGMVRPFEAADKPKAPPLGSAIIQGDAVPGEYPYGKGRDQKSPWAIQNGAAPIIVTGKLAAEHAQTKGPVRVIGKIRVADNGALIVDADQVEIPQKKK